MYATIYVYKRILFTFKKEGNPATHDNMGGHEGYYAKWNKPCTERRILHDITYTSGLK